MAIQTITPFVQGYITLKRGMLFQFREYFMPETSLICAPIQYGLGAWRIGEGNL
jgi:hypothetical protein